MRRRFGQPRTGCDWSLTKGKRRCAKGYKTRVNLYLRPTLGDVPLSRVTASHVMALRDDQAERLAPATVNGTLTCLSSMLTYCVKRQWLTVNPCRGVETVEDPDRSYNWIRTREEMTRLLAACND